MKPQRRSYMSVPDWKPREKLPNEATGTQISKMKGVYVPDKPYVREGANDHFKYKSKGL